MPPAEVVPWDAAAPEKEKLGMIGGKLLGLGAVADCKLV